MADTLYHKSLRDVMGMECLGVGGEDGGVDKGS